ncbi:MAG TPA: aldehyde dehydrogenase family protein, partial [Steroidobacteraceae bacterium]
MSGSESNINGILARLDLAPLNPGAWSGSHGWASGSTVPIVSVRNPATGTLIAQVRPAGPQEYDAVMHSAVQTAAAWRAVPAPKRGEVVRLIGEELRRAKTDL